MNDRVRISRMWSDGFRLACPRHNTFMIRKVNQRGSPRTGLWTAVVVIAGSCNCRPKLLWSDGWEVIQISNGCADCCVGALAGISLMIADTYLVPCAQFVLHFRDDR